MQSSASSVPQPEAIMDWLQKEMEYRPLGPYIASSKPSMPSTDALRRVCRGNMIPVWNFSLKRVKSEKTVENIRRNILVHGGTATSAVDSVKSVEGGRGRGRRKEKLGVSGETSSSSVSENSREIAVQEREMAEKEVERLRHIVRRQRKELKARMLEVSREEAERKRMIDERSNYSSALRRPTLQIYESSIVPEIQPEFQLCCFTMQSSASSVPQPEAILDWLQKEMEYRPLGPYIASSKASMPSTDALRRVCRGNMIPVWNFLLKRVKSEKTVENIRRNILVHGGTATSAVDSVKSVEGGRGRGRRKEKLGVSGETSSSSVSENSREIPVLEREMAEKEVERLRHIVRRQRKELKARMLEVSREEAERKRMIDERSNYRHKQVMLEAYDQQCDEAAKIFAEYHKRIRYFVNQARDSQRSSVDSGSEMITSFNANNEKESVYSTVKGSKSVDDVILVETTKERNIRKACETLVVNMIEKICNSFPAYEGNGIHSNPQLDVAKLGLDFDGEIPDEVRDAVLSCLRNPPQLLMAITAYTRRLKTVITKEIEKIDVRADAETLRYKYENNRVMDTSSDVSSPLQYQLYGNGEIVVDVPSRGTQNQLLERQKAHVQQFVATEDALNKAAEARNTCQQLLKRLHGTGDVVSSHAMVIGGTSHNSMSSLRQLELEVWAKEREAAGLKASLNTLISEVERLNKLCQERKEAEDSLKKKWKKIEEFDARRSELESIYTALLRVNMDAATFWSQQPLAAREYASSTIIPACRIVMDISNTSKDLIDKEISAFYRTPDNTLYMLPSTPQALLESMGGNGSTGAEAIAAAEKNAVLLTARAGSGDPSAIPSICRVSAALQYPAGTEGLDGGLASVLESMEFCLKLRGSEACVLEDLAKAINLVHIRRDLVESGQSLLNHAYHAQQEYERTTSCCLDLAAEQEATVSEKWLPELKNAILNARKLHDDCKYVRGLLDEWWDQPASTVIDWVTVDGQNVATWYNHVKQLLAFYDKELL